MAMQTNGSQIERWDILELTLESPEGRVHRADVIDTWKMTATPLLGAFSGAVPVDLPGKAYMALRVRAQDT